MPTFQVSIVDRQVLLVVKVGIPGTPDPPLPFPALVDTGAQMTMISQNVVDQLNAVSTGVAQIMPVSGQPIQTDQFVLDIAVPVSNPVTAADGSTLVHEHLAGRTTTTAQLPFEPPNYDVLLGMDVLSLFHITMVAGRFVMSN